MPKLAGGVLTPVEVLDGVFVKRDDLWDEYGVAHGGKARTAGLICRHVLATGGTGLCVALDRNSSVPGMLSRVCEYFGVGLHIYAPASKEPYSHVFTEAIEHGAVVHDVKTGYMSVRRKAIRDAVAADGSLREVGMGLALGEIGIEETAEQCLNVPPCVRRVVVPAGSGRTLLGVHRGLGKRGVQVVGVYVGNIPDVPAGVELIQATSKFAKAKRGVFIGSLPLDESYEAKCFEFLTKGDLLWVVAHRDTE